MRVMICEDSVLLREGLVHLLADDGHEIIAALPDASGLVERVVVEAPDLLVIDVRLPPNFLDEGIRAALAIRAERPEQPILVLSQYVEERYAAELVAGSRGGLGYLLKDRIAEVDDFLDSVTNVARGGTVLDPEVVSQLLGRRRARGVDQLTPRERDVLGLMAEGKSNHAIASSLFISEGSVEKHISAIFTKLGLESDPAGNRRVLAVLAHLGVGTDAPHAAPRRSAPEGQ